MADKDKLENEVLEFDDDSLTLPEGNPFEERRRHPWLLIGVGIIVVVLVLAVVLKLTIGGRNDIESIEIPIDKTIQTQPTELVPSDDFSTEADKMVAVPVVPEKPVEKSVVMPEREVNARKNVVFDPEKPVVQRPKPRPVAEKEKSDQKPVLSNRGVWMVQFGSYTSRAAAESGQKQLTSLHKNLFAGRDFAILSAVLPNGSTTHRLRVVGFQTNGEAAGFCKSAVTEGLSCYVAK